MANERKRFPRIIIEGIARFPSLTHPDTRFNPEGDYKVDLRVKPEDAEEYIEKLEAIRDKYYDELPEKDRRKAKKKDVFVEEEDKDGNPTGFYLFRMKQSAIVKSKKGVEYDMRPRFFDANNNLIPDEKVDKLQIWGGSLIAVQAEVKPFFIPTDKTCGVSLRPRNVQIINLVSGDGASPFSKRDGYTSSGKEADDDDADSHEEEDRRRQADDEDDDIPF